MCNIYCRIYFIELTIEGLQWLIPNFREEGLLLLLTAN